jgi:hypothetical protein
LIKLQRAPQSSSFAAIHRPWFVWPVGHLLGSVNGVVANAAKLLVSSSFFNLTTNLNSA